MPDDMMDFAYTTESFDPHAYVVQMLHLASFTVAPEQMANVVKNFELVKTIAQPVLDFHLPDDLESAPRFEP